MKKLAGYSSRFFRVRLRTQIYLGFAVLIMLMLGIAAYGSYGLSVVGEEIDIMDGIAGNANRLQELALRMEEIRRGLADYRIEPDKDALQAVTEAETRAAALLKQSAEYTLSEQRRAMFNYIAGRLRALIAGQERFATLRAADVSERTKLFATADMLKAAGNQLSVVASTDGSAAEQQAATVVRLATLAAETSGSRFLASADPAWAQRLKQDSTTAVQTLSMLSGPAVPAVRDAAAPVASALAAYIAVFDEASAAITESRSIYAEQIRPELQQMQSATGKVLDKLVKGFNSTSRKAYAISSDTLTEQLGLSAGATVIGIVLALLIARSIIRPVRGMTIAMTQLATGDTECDVTGRDRTDEIGKMAHAVEVFRQQAIENRRLAAAQEREQAAKERRQNAMDTHTADFGRSISGVMESFIAAAGTMRRSASEVAEGARRTRASTSSTVEEAMSSARDLNAVAAAAEQMAASINEISQQVTHVTSCVRAAVDRAADTDVKVAELSEAADRIGDVLRIITNIAGQTNLLALNATIEAARAGEAGKGFAVVAGEVKALAQQTTQATSQIGAQIASIRGATGEALAAVREVGTAISQVETVAAVIAAAVEEQAASTREITASVQQVTASTSTAADAMREVLSVVESTDASSAAALDASEEVSRTAGTLQTEVTDFLSAVSKGNEAERRLYERIPGGGAEATVQIAEGPPMKAEIQDISRGGIGLKWACDAPIGTPVNITLPAGGTVGGRIARSDAHLVGITFRQDTTSIIRIDQALSFIQKPVGRLAA